MEAIQDLLLRDETRLLFGMAVVFLGGFLLFRFFEGDGSEKSDEEIEQEIEAMVDRLEKDGVNPAGFRRTAHAVIMTLFVLVSAVYTVFFLRRFYDAVWFWAGLFVWGAVCFGMDAVIKNSMLVIEIRKKDKED